MYVPKKGERVRVTAVSPRDTHPKHKVGDVVTVAAVASDGREEWLTLETEEQGGAAATGTWCHVELVTETAIGYEACVEFATDARPGVVPLPPPPLVQAPALPPVYRSTDSADRKLCPVDTGVLRYFPDALMCLAFVSRNGSVKHHPGEPVHWDRSKSTDEADACARHALDDARDLPPDPGLERLGKLGHKASKAWRAVADLQKECEKEWLAYLAGQGK